MLRGGRKETSTFKINFSKISEFVDFSQWQVTEISLRGGWWREGGNCVVMARHIRILLPPLDWLWSPGPSLGPTLMEMLVLAWAPGQHGTAL